MQSLVFACPQTRQKIDSGIETDQQSLLGIRNLTVDLTCPHCGGRHRLPMKSAKFVPAEKIILQ
jgi:hypothetical protein